MMVSDLPTNLQLIARFLKKGGPKALAATIGDGAADPIMNILRVDFEGNSGFTVSAYDMDASVFSFLTILQIG